jgi:hypothetical protein
LLLGDFLKPVLIANVVAWPLGYLAARAYSAMGRWAMGRWADGPMGRWVMATTADGESKGISAQPLSKSG